tara:strand:- start:492 stop:686 length:195 start_codon:yes stop_codon:yes gene_type:complete
MTINNNKEFAGLTPFQKRMVELSIKYQTDISAMSYKDVIELLSEKDWEDFSGFIKNGCRERVVH